MKTKLLTNRTFFKAIFLLTLFTSIGCSTDEVGDSGPKVNPEAAEISDLISNLSYDANKLLNVKDTGGAPSERTLDKTTPSTTNPVKGYYQSCETKFYTLESNFNDVAILRPTNGILWPGALVVGNQGMLDGMPDPITLDRAPVTLRLDLPGMGDQGTIVVENPRNSNIQSSIDNALEWWNANAYQEGYVNASNSTYQAQTSYSSKQLSLDVGLNIEWANGSVASQLEYESSTTKRVAAMVYKQVFYTVTMDTPKTPASVFGTDVTYDEVEAKINSGTPPAYVNSVSYGRIIMFRMETTDMRKSIDLDLVLEYATGAASGSGTVNSEYDEVLKKSSITVVTIGGNAEVASEAVNATGFESLKHIITGENAVYSRDNPGVPIAYTVRYLKDNTFAKMGYTTDYKTEDCSTKTVSHANAIVDNNFGQDARFRFRYKKKGSETIAYTNWNKVKKNDPPVTARPPSGAHNVKVQFELWDLTWKYLGEFTEGYIESDEKYEVYCSKKIALVCTKVSVRRK
ncbi:thiol-activated cytolysin family protein [Algibacter sp. 2305UL17-15]|uniref:thiol-activated cytolysin family protein n=1 Tax=Algibacter sp. 2305UL17-15 TaxID=3231268 RepID=UPI003458A32F